MEFCGNPSIYGADAEVVGCDEYYVFSNEADVRLICAAPDLLEACKSQHDAIYWLSKRLMELDKSFIPPESSIWPVLQASYAAIDKATGVNDE